jgi:hypothetical protein
VGSTPGQRRGRPADGGHRPGARAHSRLPEEPAWVPAHESSQATGSR